MLGDGFIFFNIPCEQPKLDLLPCKAPGLGYLSFFFQISLFLWGGLSNKMYVAECIQADTALLEPASSRSLKFPERSSPLHSSLFSASLFSPYYLDPFLVLCLPSPSVLSVLLIHLLLHLSHTLPSILPVFFPFSCPIPFFSSMLSLGPLCSRVPFCSTNTSCLVFLAVQQMFPQRWGDRQSQ